MLRLELIFIGIIILIIIKEIYDNSKISTSNNNKTSKKEETLINTTDLNIPDVNNVTPITITPIDRNVRFNMQLKQNNITEYNDVPKPWSKVVYIQDDNYPYNYYIKLKIPSLNDYEAWKKIVPNLNFDPRSGELIIPSKDEASALALANLISINFLGQLSLDNILEKNLIQISISKAKAHEIVRNKLREQIIENLHGTKFNSSDLSFEKDLVNVNKKENDMNFSIEAYTGNDYAYL